MKITTLILGLAVIAAGTAIGKSARADGMSELPTAGIEWSDEPWATQLNNPDRQLWTRGPLGPFTNIPDTCEGIVEEMEEMASKTMGIAAAEQGLKGIGIGLQIGVAFGAVAPAWAALPVVMMALDLPDSVYYQRVEHLAKVAEIRGCRL